ncbi:MAG: filamentous hemagglutinin [Limnospira sp. PMC 1291.21]|nr:MULTISPECIES: hypothetical protein [unclassified Limnospira]EKD08171.1 filamentous hemagglutinin outer membrane protein [Arthrospira platensis C1]MDC0837017.1 filamentous hemagglutinin [Limnoraphis robusta]MDY7052701.1 filamentous hemagglutinin [Limnospira fusiformis LS22]QJB25231.1 filamentous hemagglutinin [Limnospira fusiformis SAG 85.79]RAQ48646.1 filamentous hemagglutinin [Arthrospira sp. O9.13F]
MLRQKSQQPQQIYYQPGFLGLMACAMYFNLCTLSSPALAQIRPDGTLPQNSIVTLRVYWITRACHKGNKVSGAALKAARNATSRKLAETLFKALWDMQ